MHTPSPTEITAAATKNKGFKKATLAEWGISWPPKEGWRKQLEARWRTKMILDGRRLSS